MLFLPILIYIIYDSDMEKRADTDQLVLTFWG